MQLDVTLNNGKKEVKNLGPAPRALISWKDLVPTRITEWFNTFVSTLIAKNLHVSFPDSYKFDRKTVKSATIQLNPYAASLLGENASKKTQIPLNRASKTDDSIIRIGLEWKLSRWPIKAFKRMLSSLQSATFSIDVNVPTKSKGWYEWIIGGIWKPAEKKITDKELAQRLKREIIKDPDLKMSDEDSGEWVLLGEEDISTDKKE